MCIRDRLITPIKLQEPVDTTISWLFNLDLAKVDSVFAISIGVFAISLLAVIAAALQFVQVRMTSTRPNSEDPTSGMQSTMTYTFPLLTIVWGGIFPSGLILYWVVYTAYLVIQQYLIMGWGNLFPLFGWRPRFAPAPEAGLVSRPVRRDSSEPEKPESNAAPSNQRPAGTPGGVSRPLPRPNTKKKRRGRKR